MRDDPIRVVPYDPAWPERFEQECRVLQPAIGPWLTGGIHHVGSTAVPGLAAKPVIDVLAGVAGLAESRDCFDVLGSLDYVYAPYRVAEMHWFCKPGPLRRTHHLRLVPTGSARFREELAFRNLLRADPARAAEYASLKRDLARRFERDREAYTDAKAGFIRSCLESAALD